MRIGQLHSRHLPSLSATLSKQQALPIRADGDTLDGRRAGLFIARCPQPDACSRIAVALEIGKNMHTMWSWTDWTT